MFVIIGVLSYKFYNGLNRQQPGNLSFEIPRGATLSTVLDTLNSHNYLVPSSSYKLYLKLYSMVSGKKIYAGVYLFPDKIISNRQIIESIFSGKNLNIVRVTFPEGITIYEFASILKEKMGMDSVKFVAACKNDTIMKQYGIKAKTAEGYLMPDTYDFFKGATSNKVLNVLLKTRKDIWDSKFAEIVKERKLDETDILTLASIVEAESPLPEERPRVAGLYSNRLSKGMLLQADPTVQYAIGTRRRLTYRDLTFDNKYNTYVYTGLPPGPINNPGINSIEAAINPEKNGYIYMVAVGDGSGKHNFASNKTQHDKNVAAYRHTRSAK